MNRRLTVAAVAVPALVFLVVYSVRAGHGFLLDDFEWVLNSRARSVADVWRLFAGAGGFYRPVVALTFTVNEWMWGASPLGYGLTNVVLALACATAVAFLARAFSLSAGASALAGLVWLMNFHFTRTAIMWISGRTALVVTIGAVLTATNLLRGRLGAALACLALALFAKEEAVLVPFILLAWLLILKSQTGRSPVALGRWLVASGGILGLYLLARGATPAMTPATAPSYYHFTFDPAAVFRNVAEYGDRTATVAVAVVLVAMAILGWSRPFLDARTRVAVRCGAIWLAGALGFAYFLPIRSDLYAAVPCVGACLVAAAVTERLWQGSTKARRQRVLVAAIVLPLMLAPAYWARTQRMARLADFSQTVLGDLERLTRTLPKGARVIIDDAPAESGVRVATMAAAFGAQLNEAYELRTGYRLDLALSSDASSGSEGRAETGEPVLRLAVKDGRLQVVDPPRK